MRLRAGGWRVALVTAVSWAVLASAAASAAGDVTLVGSTLTVNVVPSTLKVTARPGFGPELVLSAGQVGLGPVEGLTATTSSLEFVLPERCVTVRMVLDGAELSVDVRSAVAGAFTWPVLDLGRPFTDLIWPHDEGYLVPLDDDEWRSWLENGEWDTYEGLSMPFFGLRTDEGSVTYIATNRSNNVLRFEPAGRGLGGRFVHEFPATVPPGERSYGFVIRPVRGLSVVEPARQFRLWLQAQGRFVTMRDKIARVPLADRLLGAPQVYVWGDGFFTRHDVRRGQWSSFCTALAEQAARGGASVAEALRTRLEPKSWQLVEEVAQTGSAYRYLTSELAAALSRVLLSPDLLDGPAWQGVELPEEAVRLRGRDRASLTPAERARMNALAFQAAFAAYLEPVSSWGDGVSVKFIRMLGDGGLDRARLCVDGRDGVELRPEVASQAEARGYLFGIYDSFNSIHDPALRGTDDSWPTAQFDEELFRTGAIVRPDGRKRAGFKGVGFLLSPRAARPWVERRVREAMQCVPYSYYFIDCDAFGQVYDDCSPDHPSTQGQDAQERVARMRWISDTFAVPVGSEGSSSYAAPVVHVLEGVLTSVFGWGDEDMHDKASPYYVGGYYPADGPQVYLSSVPLKDRYVRRHYDPRFRLPLVETVFHDSVVATHHWSSGSLKFTNVRDTTALLEMLYQCPPLYHLTMDEWPRQRGWIMAHQAVFGPLHRVTGLLPLEEFSWLTADRLVQRTLFGDQVEVVANFGLVPHAHRGSDIPPRSVRATRLGDGTSVTYTPPRRP